MKQICIIIVYFGPWPDWFPYFLQSCAHNKHIHWLIFSDQEAYHNNSNNIFIRPFRKVDFEKLVQDKLGLYTVLRNPYKLCDFKPAYGKIFEDYLESYRYWGYSDIDMLYGRIEDFIFKGFNKKYDVISGYRSFLSGPFCLFKNTGYINNLFTRIYNYDRILSDPEHYGMDENNKRSKTEASMFRKISLLPGYILNTLKTSYIFPPSLKEIRYQFGWHCKREFIKSEELRDMTEVVWHSRKEKKINVQYKELIFSDRYFKRNHTNRWKIHWKNGVLNETYSNTQIMAFHFLDIKYQLKHFSVDPDKHSISFSITPDGIELD